MKTGKQIFNKILSYDKFYWDDTCSPDGVYLSDGCYMRPSEYAQLTGTMSKKHQKELDKLWAELEKLRETSKH